MSAKNYCMVNQSINICENIVLWDGNPETWTPPADYLMLVQDQTMAKVWVLNADKTQYQLEPLLGVGQIGYLWDGEFLITNEPAPPLPTPSVAAPDQPDVTGAQTL